MAIVRQDQPRQQADFDFFDFERLPSHLFIQILGQLKFRQRFSIARVSRRFKKMSDLSVTLINSFYFNYDFPDVDTFRTVLEKFARDLQTAGLLGTTSTTERIDAALDFEFPRLAYIIIVGWADGVPNLLRRCSNLRRLKFLDPGEDQTIDLGQSVFPLVESVDFECCSSNMVERILDACPNIKHFSMRHTRDETWQLIRKLNQYFADRVDTMESISMTFCPGSWDPPLLQDGFVGLWNLRSLRVLKIELDDITSIDINAISNSFPNLQTLRLKTRRLDGSISALSKLKNLVNLELDVWNLRDNHIYEFVLTSEAQGLRRFEIKGSTVSLRMILHIVERFPRLKYLSISNGNSSCWAVSNFAKQLRKFAQRNLKIDLFSDNGWLLESGRVRRAIEELRRAAGDDERRRGLELDLHLEVRNVAGNTIEIVWLWIVLMFYRVFL